MALRCSKYIAHKDCCNTWRVSYHSCCQIHRCTLHKCDEQFCKCPATNEVARYFVDAGVQFYKLPHFAPITAQVSSDERIRSVEIETCTVELKHPVTMHSCPHHDVAIYRRAGRTERG